jgi:hypothetical protein
LIFPTNAGYEGLVGFLYNWKVILEQVRELKFLIVLNGNQVTDESGTIVFDTLK